MEKGKKTKTELKLQEHEKREIIDLDNEIYLLKENLINLTRLEVKEIIEDLLKDIQYLDNSDDIKDKKKQIKNLLIEYNKNIFVDDSTILNMETEKVDSQNDDLKNQNFIGFVYYFWSPSTMNFKIIGLTSLYPLFELENTKEMYYLDKPTMITNDVPIYWISKGIPFTLELEVKEQLLQLNQKVFENGYNADLIEAMVNNQNWIAVYGKDRWSFKAISFILTIMLCEGLICYIIFSNIMIASVGAG